MPWARIPPDRLIHLPLFGIDVIADDGDFLWLRGPSGRMRVNKLMPRIFFETVEDAMQAGATAIRMGGEEDRRAYEEFIARLAAEAEEAAEAQTASEGDDSAASPEDAS